MNQVKNIAGALNGLEYRKRPHESIIELAKEAGIVIVYGASDDLMELDGAVYEELNCYAGGTAYFTPEGLLVNRCGPDCPHDIEAKKHAVIIESLWCKEGDYSWTYKTEIPHETFEVVEDGEPYCRGIVFKLSDVKATR